MPKMPRHTTSKVGMSHYTAFAVNARVRISGKHWMCAGRLGTVIGHRPTLSNGRPAQNQIQVKLDLPYVGKADVLFFAEREIVALDEPKPTKTALKRQDGSWKL